MRSKERGINKEKIDDLCRSLLELISSHKRLLAGPSGRRQNNRAGCPGLGRDARRHAKDRSDRSVSGPFADPSQKGYRVFKCSELRVFSHDHMFPTYF